MKYVLNGSLQVSIKKTQMFLDKVGVGGGGGHLDFMIISFNVF